MKLNPPKRFTLRGTGVEFSAGVGWAILIGLLVATFATGQLFILLILAAFVLLLHRA